MDTHSLREPSAPHVVGSLEYRSPRSAEDFEKYYQLRWEVLRKPHLKAQGTERDDMENAARHMMALTQDGHVVGVGRIHIREDGVAQIRYMAVDPNFTGQGIGQRIVAELESLICSANGSCPVELNSRNKAVPFYEKCGYTITAQGQRLWGIIPHSIMQKEITCNPSSDKASTLKQSP